MGSDKFLLSAKLENYGATGTNVPTLLTSGSITVTNSAAAADNSVYASFGGFNNVTAFDNFSVTAVPEPSGFQLMTLGGLLAALMRVRLRALKR